MYRLRGTVSNGNLEKNSKWKKMCLRGELNLRPLAFKRVTLTWLGYRASWRSIVKTLSLLFGLLLTNMCDNACTNLMLVRYVLKPRAWEKGDCGDTCPSLSKVCVGCTNRLVSPHFVNELSYRKLAVRQNLHFFNQYIYHLLLFTEICMDKPNHNQFITSIVTRYHWL